MRFLLRALLPFYSTVTDLFVHVSLVQIGFFGQPLPWVLDDRDSWKEAEEREVEDVEKEKEAELIAERAERARVAAIARKKAHEAERVRKEEREKAEKEVLEKARKLAEEERQAEVRMMFPTQVACMLRALMPAEHMRAW